MTLATESMVLCSGSLRTTRLEERVEAAAAAGFTGMSLYYDDYADATQRGWTDEGLRRLFADHGLTVAEFDGAMRWLPGDERGPSLESFVGAAAAIGARSVTVIEVGGRRPDRDLAMDDVVGAYARVCDLALPSGLLAHLEYFPFSGIDDLRTAHRIHRLAGRPNSGVLVDTWHHLRGPDAGRLDLDVPGSEIVAVQVSDIAAVRSADVAAETMHGRLLPGHGHGDVLGLVRAIRATGSVAPIGIEVYSDELHALDPFEAARRCARSLRELLDGSR